MNKVKRAARAHHYNKIGFEPAAAIALSDNRTFKSSRHFEKGDPDMIRQSEIAKRQSRIKNYIKRFEFQMRQKFSTRKKG